MHIEVKYLIDFQKWYIPFNQLRWSHPSQTELMKAVLLEISNTLKWPGQCGCPFLNFLCRTTEYHHLFPATYYPVTWNERVELSLVFVLHFQLYLFHRCMMSMCDFHWNLLPQMMSQPDLPTPPSGLMYLQDLLTWEYLANQDDQ